MSLEIFLPQEPSLNKVAPTVFIESVDLEDNKATVYYSFENTNNWISNNAILDSTDLYLGIADQTSKKNLRNVLNSSTVRNNQIYSSETFDLAQIKNLDSSLVPITITSSFEQQTTDISEISNITTIQTSSVATSILIKAFCGGKDFIGTQVTEPLFISGSLAKTTYGDKTFKYVSKIKNLDLLKTNFLIQSSSYVNSNAPIIRNEIFVSNTLDKKAHLACVFSLRSYLENFSNIFNNLKNYPVFSSLIINNSKINLEKTKFYKKNLSENKKDYEPISNSVVFYKLGDVSNSYVLSTTDYALTPEDESSFGVKVKVTVDDYSYTFLQETLLKQIILAKKLIITYKEKLIEYFKNSDIKNPKIFYYENDYESKINEIKDAINYLSMSSVMLKGGLDSDYYSLFYSLFHPLTTTVENLQKLENYCFTIEKFFKALVFNNSFFNESSSETNSKNVEFYEFDFSKNHQENYNFKYKSSYGYEVITTDSQLIRKQDNNIGIKLLTQEQLKARQLVEASKYLNNAPVNLQQTNTLSACRIDFGEASYDLLTNVQRPNEISNEIMIKINEFNNYNFRFDTLKSIVYQTLSDGVNIKSFTARNNNSVNSLNPSTLSDVNQDTSETSEEFIRSTNIDSFYYVLNKKQLLPLPSGSLQQIASTGSNGISPTFRLTEFVLSEPPLNARVLLYYNFIYKLANVISSANYDLVSLEESTVNEVFNKKLKLFNKFFIILKRQPEDSIKILSFSNSIDDLIVNIPSKFLNRKTFNAFLNVNLDSL